MAAFGVLAILVVLLSVDFLGLLGTGDMKVVPKESDNDPATALVSGTCAILSIDLMTVAAISIRPRGLAVRLDLAFGALAMILSGILAYTSKENFRGNGAQEQQTAT